VAASKTFPIVGIGASAGGVEALGNFFRPMPSDTGMAFVLVMHLPLGHDSTMPEILRRVTHMPVTMAGDGKPVEANHVYVCPADHILTLSNRSLHLQPRVSPVQAHPINVFLSSLAQDLGESAIGVILSGAGSDGTLGLKAIKDRRERTQAKQHAGHGDCDGGGRSRRSC
jgi:two-component system CheB/CheR fusion protein